MSRCLYTIYFIGPSIRKCDLIDDVPLPIIVVPINCVSTLLRFPKINSVKEIFVNYPHINEGNKGDCC